MGAFNFIRCALFFLLALLVQANLILPDGSTLSTFDCDWKIRPPHEFNVTGVLHNGVNFTGSACATSVTRPLTATDIVHVHFPDVQSAGCEDISTLAQSLASMYEGGNKFAALLVTFDSGESTGKYTPYGNPELLQGLPFQLSIGPLATAMSLWSFTGMYTETPIVTLRSDPGPWNDFDFGDPATIFDAILSAVYVGYFAYASYLHIEHFAEGHRCVLPLTFKTWMFICIQFFTSFQVLSLWLPQYPAVISSFFFWYSYMFGFVSYTLTLFTWIRIVRRDRISNGALSKTTVRALYGFGYIAIFLVFCIATSCVIATPYPHIKSLVTVKNAFFYSFPAILVSQAAVFLYNGVKLIRSLKTFNMTPEKKSLMRRMSILMTFAVGTYVIAALMALIIIFFSDTLIGSWISRVLRDVTVAVLILVIFFTLHTSRSSRSTAASGVSGPSQNKLPHLGKPSKGAEYNYRIQRTNITRSSEYDPGSVCDLERAEAPGRPINDDSSVDIYPSSELFLTRADVPTACLRSLDSWVMSPNRTSTVLTQGVNRNVVDSNTSLATDVVDSTMSLAPNGA